MALIDTMLKQPHNTHWDRDAWDRSVGGGRDCRGCSPSGFNAQVQYGYWGNFNTWTVNNYGSGYTQTLTVTSKFVKVELPKLHNNPKDPMLSRLTQGESKGGFDWFVGAEGAATLGWENFAIEVKNVGGVDYKRGARDWRVTSSSKYGGTKPVSKLWQLLIELRFQLALV